MYSTILDWSNPFHVSLNLIYFSLVIGTVMVVILDNRNPVKTMSWILVLIFLPVIGLLFYFFFGQNIRKERLISKRNMKSISQRPLRKFWQKSMPAVPHEWQSLSKLFRRMDRAIYFEGNNIGVHTDGYTMLQSLLRDIKYARHHIHMEYYIFEDDAIGRLVSDALIDKAREGVEVRLLYDDVGCWRVKDKFFARMKSAGVKVYPFLKVRFPILTNRVNYRNHRKITIIDGRIGYIGGMNIAERYLHGLPWGKWRDTTLTLDGPSVYSLQSVFLMDWCFVTQEMINDDVYFPASEPTGNAPVQVVTSKPFGKWHELMQGYLYAISKAQKYIYIQTPYFMPTEEIVTALQTAALAGVDVRIMLPWKADSRIVQMCSRSYMREVMEAGVKVLFYHTGFLHSKMMVIDDTLASVGSANMDFRSLEYNMEANAFIYDAETAIGLRNIFLSDQEECVHISTQRWARRSFWRKVEESLLRLLAPLM